MGEKGFFLVFAIILIALFISGVNGGFSNTATSTVLGTGASTSQNAQSGSTGDSSRSSVSSSQTARYGTSNATISNKPTENKTNFEIQAELEDLYDEVWELAQKVDSFLRRQPVSRYADDVRLSRSSATSENPDREYLTLSLNKNSAPVNISSWYLESYVTEKRVAIPDGTEIFKAGGALNQTRPIILKPGGRAFLITGESPVGVSLKENSCTGYLREDEDFYPRLSYNCPYPKELMERYGDIELDDDSCYDFVSRVGRCRTIEDDDERLDSISGKCERFIKTYLNYNSCVEAFSWRTDFYDEDDWYIYFERDEEKWRRKREIIRLIDEFDEVVAVLEY